MAKKAAKKAVNKTPAKPAKKTTTKKATARKKVPAGKERRGGSRRGIRKGSWAACSEEGAVLLFALVFRPVQELLKRKKEKRRDK